jgi:hypothetical protein
MLSKKSAEDGEAKRLGTDDQRITMRHVPKFYLAFIRAADMKTVSRVLCLWTLSLMMLLVNTVRRWIEEEAQMWMTTIDLSWSLNRTLELAPLFRLCRLVAELVSFHLSSELPKIQLQRAI